jgi:queuine tRNA-ribosyltransferase
MATPVFMPVATQGALKAFDHAYLERIGVEFLLANTYHLFLRPGLETLSCFGGLKGFAHLDAALLTDSGGFQAFSLAPLVKFSDEGIEFRSHHDGSKHLFTPESVLAAQSVMGSDIRMLLDQVAPYGEDKEVYRRALRRTNDWVHRSWEHWQGELAKKEGPAGGEGLPFPILQGGFFPELRREGAREITDYDFPGFAVGGLSVGEKRPVYRDMAYLTGELLPENKPRYIMGVGAIQDILLAIDAGFDMFDSVLPTRNARNGGFLTSLGVRNIRNARFRREQDAIDPQCSCAVCRHYSAAYLHHLFHTKEILAAMAATEHNLYFVQEFVRQARHSLEGDRFADFMAAWLEVYPLSAGVRGVSAS